MAETWFDKLGKSVNVVFTEEDFRDYSEMIKEGLPVYRKYLVEGARILELGCGLGCGSVPLSNEGFRVVAIDNDPQVVEVAIQNGKNFGGTIEFRLMNVFDIDEEFAEDSFDACTHGGLLEHFSKEGIRLLVDKQFHVAPLIICSMPVRTDRTLEHYKVKEVENKEICIDGIKRNLWTQEQWLNDVLEGYDVAESRITRCSPKIGDFDELFLVLNR